MKKLRIVILFLVLFTINIFSQSLGSDQELIVSQGEVLSTAGGICSNIGVAASFFNPALLYKINFKYVLNTGIFNGIFNYDDSISYLNLATMLNPKIHLYLGYNSYTSQTVIITSPTGEIINDNYDISGDNMFKIGFSYLLFPKLNFGLIYSSFSRKIPGFNDNDPIDLNVMYLSPGVSYRTNKFNLGFSIMDIPIKKDKYNTDQYAMLNLMAGLKLLNDSLNINGIFSMITRDENDMRIGLGAEYNIKKFIYFRLSFFEGINALSDGLYAGIGIHYKFFTINYTFSFGELTTYHYLSLTLGLKNKNLLKNTKNEKKIASPKYAKKKYPKPNKKILVAVLDFEGKNISKDDAGIITDFIRQDMINSGYFTVLERSAIKSILKEVNFQQTGCTSAECAVQIGKVLAVRKMVVGSVSKLGKKFFITLRMVDVETSQIDVATSIGIEAPIEELPSYVNKLVNQMIESLNSKH